MALLKISAILMSLFVRLAVPYDAEAMLDPDVGARPKHVFAGLLSRMHTFERSVHVSVDLLQERVE